MKTLKWTDPSSAQDLLQQAQQEDVLVMRDGKPVAVVMPLADDDAEWIEREMDPEFIASIAQAREDFRAGKGIPLDQAKRELGL